MYVVDFLIIQIKRNFVEWFCSLKQTILLCEHPLSIMFIFCFKHVGNDYLKQAALKMILRYRPKNLIMQRKLRC